MMDLDFDGLGAMCRRKALDEFSWYDVQKLTPADPATLPVRLSLLAIAQVIFPACVQASDASTMSFGSTSN
jgi:hypothetical protein